MTLPTPFQLFSNPPAYLPPEPPRQGLKACRGCPGYGKIFGEVILTRLPEIELANDVDRADRVIGTTQGRTTMTTKTLHVGEIETTKAVRVYELSATITTCGST